MKEITVLGKIWLRGGRVRYGKDNGTAEVEFRITGESMRIPGETWHAAGE
jgi:hypothetical protein